MPIRNSVDRYGWLAQLLHWTSAAAFIGAYCLVYFGIWFLVDETPARSMTLNLHWVFGTLVGALVIPRLLWKHAQMGPDEVPGTAQEHALARVTHGLLYALMILMTLTGYLGTRSGTDFGLFFVPSFRDTALFGWISSTWSVSFKEFEGPLDAMHHFVGRWIAWPIVGLHVAAALYHHWVRRDGTLLRMLPGGARDVGTDSSQPARS